MKLQKRLASDILKCSPKRVKLDSASSDEIKKAITKMDVKHLIKQGAIKKIPKKGISRARANKKQIQKRKGRQKGHGSRKGKASARTPKKATWMAKARTQRKLIKKLRTNQRITTKTFRELYLKIKGGFFRNKRHMKLLLEEKNLIIKKEN